MKTSRALSAAGTAGGLLEPRGDDGCPIFLFRISLLSGRVPPET